MITPSKNNSFIKQAGILALAGIICRMIGILYRSPLTGIIGDKGNGYYTYAYNIYAIILLVSSYSVPSAISREISIKLAFNEYKNAQRVLYCAFIYVIVIGGLASILTYIGADLFLSKNSAIVLKVFAPTIFFSGLLGVFRGYFQAQNTMLQTSISQIIEQTFNAIISILAAYFLMNSFTGSEQTTRAVYGAAGSAVGTGCGVIIALIFMWSVYIHRKSTIKNQIQMDQSSKIISYKRIFKGIIRNVTPMILSTSIYNLSTFLNQSIYAVIQSLRGYSEDEYSTQYGIFSVKAIIITNIPIAISSAMSSAIMPGISASYIQGNLEDTNQKVDTAIRTTMLISIPAAIGLAVLSKPVVWFLYPQKASLMQAANLLRWLSVSVVFYSLSTLSNTILQGIGKPSLPVINALNSLFIQTIILSVLLFNTNLNLYSLVIATIVYSLFMCIFNGLSVRKHLGYRLNIRKSFLIPLTASAFMGLFAAILYKLIYHIIRSNAISLIITIFLACIFYFIIIIRFGGVNEAELESLPYGKKIVSITKRLKIFNK